MSFESLERAQARSYERQLAEDQATKPRIPRSVKELQLFLGELDPQKQLDETPVTLNTTVSGLDQTGARCNYEVTVPTKSRTKRELLLAGFQIIKNRQDSDFGEQVPLEVNGHQMRPARLYKADGPTWVDALIYRWFGATRVGLEMTWVIDRYTYKYDIFAHKLRRAADAERS